MVAPAFVRAATLIASCSVVYSICVEMTTLHVPDRALRGVLPAFPASVKKLGGSAALLAMTGRMPELKSEPLDQRVPQVLRKMRASWSAPRQPSSRPPPALAVLVPSQSPAQGEKLLVLDQSVSKRNLPLRSAQPCPPAGQKPMPAFSPPLGPLDPPSAALIACPRATGASSRVPMAPAA